MKLSIHRKPGKMRHDFLDRYSRLDSPIHRLPAWVKLVTALALVATVLLIPLSRWPLFSAVAGVLVVVAGLSRIPWLFLARRLLMLEPFVIGVAALALLRPDGWRIFLLLLARCTLCLLVMVLLANTTPFWRLLGTLKSAGMPALLVTTLSLMYRYIFVLADEAQRMKRARSSRTFTRRRGRIWHATSTVAGQLFIRASERAERIYAAMCARGLK
jgi:cobalt/nickel transport system permease protein